MAEHPNNNGHQSPRALPQEVSPAARSGVASTSLTAADVDRLLQNVVNAMKLADRAARDAAERSRAFGIRSGIA